MRTKLKRILRSHAGSKDKHSNPDRDVWGDAVKQSSEDVRSVYAKPGDRTGRKANMALKIEEYRARRRGPISWDCVHLG